MSYLLSVLHQAHNVIQDLSCVSGQRDIWVSGKLWPVCSEQIDKEKWLPCDLIWCNADAPHSRTILKDALNTEELNSSSKVCPVPASRLEEGEWA